jgi:membrane protease YdiL (CAAX protease family)
VTAVAIVFAIAVVAPIAEEISFRGYLFPALTRWRGPWLAAVVTGLLFGAAHFLVYPPAFLPALAFFGFGSCLLFWFTGSLLPSICLHAINNAIAACVLLGWSWQVPIGVLGCVAAALLLLAPFARERAPQTA